MFVRIHKIESIHDIDGNLGKRIELVEARSDSESSGIHERVFHVKSEEAQMMHDVMQTLQQQFPMLPMRANVTVPKIILFLTEQEYESLDIKFDVNQVYEVNLANQTLRFTKTEV